MAGSGTAHLRDGEHVMRVEHLVVEYRSNGGQPVQAVSDVSFDIARGETLGLVGESGCGKSSTGRAIMMMPPPTSGSVSLLGNPLTGLSARALRHARPEFQMIFQDPIASLNPRRKVKDIVAEGLAISGRRAIGDAARVRAMLTAVGLDPDAVADRRPHELSGGQCQRVAIARALQLEPAIIICDEPVSSLDVSVQAQILNLLEDMKARYALTLLFIAHDLAVVKNISDRIAVMYLGKLCEVAPSDHFATASQHPYTNALLEAVPGTDTRLGAAPSIRGDVPSPVNPPSGCRFRTRCPRAQARCAAQEPVMQQVAPDHFVACHFPGSETAVTCSDSR